METPRSAQVETPAPSFHAPQETPREEAPRREDAPRREAAPRAEEPRINPKELLDSAGLVMIETDRAKAAPVAPPAEEPAHLGRPRRERAKTAEEEELKQVETKR